MLNRKVQPPVTTIRTLDIPEIKKIFLDNGVPLVIINSGTEDIIKFEIIHKAGKSVEDKKLVSRATSSLLKEGCGSWDSETFAEKFDFYGAGMKTASNMDFMYTSVYTLGKHFREIVQPLSVMYQSPCFDVAELENFKRVNVQKLKEELTKNEVLSYRLITESIFGSSHAYGYNSNPDDYVNMQLQDIQQHFQKYIGTDNMTLFVSGKITDPILQLINLHFGQYQKATVKKLYVPCQKDSFHQRLIEKAPNDFQCSLKLGRRLFDRTHPDQSAFFLLNTVLGGYFGSRLMDVLREKKGYTYDISSQMDQMLHDGCFYIDTELSSENLDETIQEIYKQMDRLQDKKVSSKELDMVKNYLAGTFLHMVDGPLQLSVVAKTLELIGLPYTALQDWIKDIMDITPEDVRNCAQKYLGKEHMVEIIVQ
ncbi:MAG: pitrilysin family protein [Saprospiraceae bacterium]